MAKPVAKITEHEQEQLDNANASGLTPVVFVHGLWLLPSSWDRWRRVFEEAGYTGVLLKAPRGSIAVLIKSGEHVDVAAAAAAAAAAIEYL